MINFKYEHISEIMRLAEEEIRRLESEKEVRFPKKNISIDEEMNDLLNKDVNELDVRIRLLKEIKDGFAQELKKISFSFGMGDKPYEGAKYFHENKPEPKLAEEEKHDRLNLANQIFNK